MSNANTQSTKKFVPDVNRSSYRWIIHLTNGYHLNGYSKDERKTEILDKSKLLMRKIIMLSKSNYFDPERVMYIELFGRTGLGEYQNHFLTLYPTRYEALTTKLKTHSKMIFFLETVYNLIKCGNISQLDYDIVPYSTIKEADLFKLESGRFKNIDELQKFCTDMLIECWPLERVEHFQREYKQRYFI